MTDAKDVYQHCDELEKLPAIHRLNWLFELELLSKTLEPNATVLQVGCMDGKRIMRLLEKRPDLQITGLDIDAPLLAIAQKNFGERGMAVPTILADITYADALPKTTFAYVLCLNNTLGYIEDEEAAIANMRALGRTVILSVYGEIFNDTLARAYCACLGLRVGNISGNVLDIDDFGRIRRYSRNDVEQWGGKIIETPLGYCSILHSVS